MVPQHADTTSRLLARLVRELLATKHFETMADLTDALKWRCARLRIRWTPDDISEAYRLIESNRPLPGFERIKPPKRIERIERIDVEPVSKAEAQRVLARLGIRL